jgi:hypothetical protein
MVEAPLMPRFTLVRRRDMTFQKIVFRTAYQVGRVAAKTHTAAQEAASALDSGVYNSIHEGIRWGWKDEKAGQLTDDSAPEDAAVALMQRVEEEEAMMRAETDGLPESYLTADNR